MPLVRLEQVGKTYRTGEVSVRALHDVSFEIAEGEVCVIVGASGAGKTTLLNLLGGMDTITEGHIYFDGKDLAAASDRERTRYRRQKIGFVFQFYNLIPNLSALENVELAASLGEHPLSPEQVLKDVGLGDRMDHFPARLSGGEQQRVAIARALAKNPRLLLCDEPTGALDYQTGKAILQLLQDTSRKTGMTVVIITHNQALCGMADRVVHVQSGTVTAIEQNPAPMPVQQIEW